MTDLISIIRKRQPSKHAHGEGINTARKWRQTQADLLVDVTFAELERDIERVLRDDLSREQFERIQESF